MKFYTQNTNRRETLPQWIASEQSQGLTVYANASGDGGAPYVSLSHGEDIEGTWQELTPADVAQINESMEVAA